MNILKLFLVLVLCSLFFGLDNAYEGIEKNSIVENTRTSKEILEVTQENESEEELFQTEKNKIDTKEKNNDSSENNDSENEELNTIGKQEGNTNKLETNEELKKENVEEVWDKLGISEYEYYNTPQWKWQKIDFKLNGNDANSCNSSEDCRNKCISYGDNYILKKGGGYRCSEVLSYSGKYLGEYFKYFELES